MMNIQPIVIEGQHVRLEPLSLDHLDRLAQIGLNQAIWRWAPEPIVNREDMQTYIETALLWQRDGTALPFATVENKSGKPIGSTRFAQIDTDNRRAEIGWTWLNPEWHRTAINTEAKYLMLTHAFDTWGCVRVEFKTDAMNQQSRNAILRLGAKEEGTLRKHMTTSTGRFRDSVYYSILDTEWPDVRRLLVGKLQR